MDFEISNFPKINIFFSKKEFFKKAQVFLVMNWFRKNIITILLHYTSFAETIVWFELEFFFTQMHFEHFVKIFIII